jgi:broad specificity phosphatase PhoE
MQITLIRHGESFANSGAVNPEEVDDHTIGLTQLGREQARQAGQRLAGQRLGAAFFDGALAYCSPFRRARETMQGSLKERP